MRFLGAMEMYALSLCFWGAVEAAYITFLRNLQDIAPPKVAVLVVSNDVVEQALFLGNIKAFLSVLRIVFAANR